MNRQSPIIPLLCGLMLSALSAHAVPIKPEPTNPQYFVYQDQVIPLVGASASYLCHVDQWNQDESYCTWNNYCRWDGFNCFASASVNREGYIDQLQRLRLNKMRLWIAVNHSPGRDAQSGIGRPYDHEQPFLWVDDPSSTDPNKGWWDLYQWNQEFFNRLLKVVDYARSRNVIVEVTLFDPWTGDWTQGPWHCNNVYNNAVVKTCFTQRLNFVTLTNGSTADEQTKNSNARARQVALMKKVADTLNHLDNVYYEIANEPEINGSQAGDGTAVAAWHNSMIPQLATYDGNLPNGRHSIAVNYHTTVALGTVTTDIGILTGHYVALRDEARVSAIELIRNYHAPAPLIELNRVFGFNESKISPIQVTDVRAVRAEAWEFMLNEGGLFDHLGYQWRTSTLATGVRRHLGFLNDYLKSFTLQFMGRQNNNPPLWCSNLRPYDTADPVGGGRTFWGAMQWTRNQYALYIHHSLVDTDATKAFRSYIPKVTSPAAYQDTCNLGLGTLPGTFLAEWIDPSNGMLYPSSDPTAPSSVTISWPGSGSYTLKSPKYTFDIALRIKRTA
jgi:hypothetical protein